MLFDATKFVCVVTVDAFFKGIVAHGIGLLVVVRIYPHLLTLKRVILFSVFTFLHHLFYVGLFDSKIGFKALDKEWL